MSLRQAMQKWAHSITFTLNSCNNSLLMIRALEYAANKRYNLLYRRLLYSMRQQRNNDNMIPNISWRQCRATCTPQHHVILNQSLGMVCNRRIIVESTAITNCTLDTVRHKRHSSDERNSFNNTIEGNKNYMNSETNDNLQQIKSSLRTRKQHLRENLLKRRDKLEETLAIALRESDLKGYLMKRREILKEALQQRKEKINDSEKNIRERGRVIIDDMRDTKNLMKEKLEKVIERENIYTVPNFLCVTRIVFSPYLGYLIVSENFDYALGFMIIASLSDWLDGWIARNYPGQSTKIGSFLDPMADKVLIGTLFLTLTYVQLIPLALTILIVARDVSLVAAGFVIRFKSLPPPRTLAGYFDATHATAQLAPTLISKVNTGIQLTLIGATLAAPVFGYVGHEALDALCYVTATSTILAAASYLTTKDTYRYLRRK